MNTSISEVNPINNVPITTKQVQRVEVESNEL